MTADILTNRLLLRPPVPSDAPAVQRELAKWDIAKMLARVSHPLPYISNDEWWAERHPRAFPDKGLWAMLSLKGDQTRAAIGNIALCPRDGKWGLGYWLAEDHWGVGLMSEAVEAALSHVVATWAPDKIEAGAFHDNPSSSRILENAGFACTGSTPEWCEARQLDVPHWNFLLITSKQANT